MYSDWVQQDLGALNHECGHATVAVFLGRKLIRVIGHRHQTRFDNEAGSVEWLRDENDGFGNAVVCLAGRVAEGHFDLDSNTHDYRVALKECPLGLDRALAEAFAILNRKDVCRARAELGHALAENGYVLDGVSAEHVIEAALRT